MPEDGGPLGVGTRRDEVAPPAVVARSAGPATQRLAGVLLAFAAALVAGSMAAAGSGLISYVTAGTVSLAAAALSGISVALNQSWGRTEGRASGRLRHPAAGPAPPHAPQQRHRQYHHSTQHQQEFPRPGHSRAAPPRPAVPPAGTPATAPVSAGIRYRNRLRWAFVLAVVFLGIEAVAAATSGSLTLLSDVGHVFADVIGLGMALAAIHLAGAGSRHRSRTYGLYRVEIVAALANAVLLVGMAGYVIFEAVSRLGRPHHVPGGTMVVVAVAGLFANLVSVWLLRPGANDSLNVRGAYLDVVADAIGSAGLLVAGVTIRITDWAWIDPLIGAALGLWILPRAVILGREALRILVQAAPAHVDVAALEADLSSVEGVVDVHHLHIWTLTSDVEVASAHLRVADGVDSHRVLVDARGVLNDRYHLTNVTLQVESAGGGERCAGI